MPGKKVRHTEDTHEFIGDLIVRGRLVQSDIETQRVDAQQAVAAIVERPTYAELATGAEKPAVALTRIPTVPVVAAKAYYKTIVLRWDSQPNLGTAARGARLQVSIDQTEWYAPDPTGADWKTGAIGGYAEVAESEYTYQAPYLMSGGQPVSRTYYFRVARVSSQEVSAWSSVVSGTVAPVEGADIKPATITADKIDVANLAASTAFITSLFSKEIVIGENGSIRGGGRYNASGNVVNPSVNGFWLGVNGLLKASGAEFSAAGIGLGGISSDLLPTASETYSLGSATKKWGRIFVNEISGGATSLLCGTSLNPAQSGLKLGGELTLWGETWTSKLYTSQIHRQSNVIRVHIGEGASLTGDSAAGKTLELYQGGAGDALLTFHISNVFACHFGLDRTTNELYVGGWSLGANKYKLLTQKNSPSGTYTPSQQAYAGVTSSTPITSFYSGNNGIITATVRFSGVNSKSQVCLIKFSPPIPSDFTGVNDAMGTMELTHSSGDTIESGVVTADPEDNWITLTFWSPGTSNATIFAVYQYIIRK